MGRFDNTTYVDNPSITSGFFNSNENGDRTYDADTISSMFDGVITDGVFASIGEAFNVTPNTGMIINIGPGKAWFNHVWLNNDTITSIELESPQWLSRRDVIAIEINKKTSDIDDETGIDRGREGHIVVISGSASENPENPELLDSDGIYQYPIAVIDVRANATEIRGDDIHKCVGAEYIHKGESVIRTPFVQASQPIDVENILYDWNSKMSRLIGESTGRFEMWFQNLKNELDEQQATNLQNQINDIIEWLDYVGRAEEEML